MYLWSLEKVRREKHYEMPLNLYWKQHIIQLYMESVRSYGEVVRMLRDEGKIIPKKTGWSVVRKYKEHGMLSHLPGSG